MTSKQKNGAAVREHTLSVIPASTIREVRRKLDCLDAQLHGLSACSDGLLQVTRLILENRPGTDLSSAAHALAAYQAEMINSLDVLREEMVDSLPSEQVQS